MHDNPTHMAKSKLSNIVNTANKIVLGVFAPRAVFPPTPKKAGPRKPSKLEEKIESAFPGKYIRETEFYLNKAARLDRNLTQLQRTRVRKAKKK